jgi:hypothetical protein
VWPLHPSADGPHAPADAIIDRAAANPRPGVYASVGETVRSKISASRCALRAIFCELAAICSTEAEVC